MAMHDKWKVRALKIVEASIMTKLRSHNFTVHLFFLERQVASELHPSGIIVIYIFN
jgi:hypothetical protein